MPNRSRLRPRSIRARVAAGSVAAAAVILLVFGVLTSVLVRAVVHRGEVERAAEAAREVVMEIQSHRVEGKLRPRGGVSRLQVVAPDGEVLASGGAARDTGPLTEVRPSRPEAQVVTTRCPQRRTARCLTIVGYAAADSHYGDVLVYAAVPRSGLVSFPLMEVVVLGLGLALLVPTGALAWWGAGRTLRPVEDIRTDLEHITASDLGRRVAVPDTGDEVARLARTVNDTLRRLAAAMDRQRGFVSDASHELRNPIAGLRTRLEVELADPGGDVREALRGALADTERLERIVSDLLELARLDADVATAREPVDLGDLAESEVRRRGAPPRVESEAEPRLFVYGNRLRLVRLLTNLLGNAERHARERVLVTVEREGQEVVLRVHDDGNGVPEQERERIFDRFARLAGRAGATPAAPGWAWPSRGRSPRPRAAPSTSATATAWAARSSPCACRSTSGAGAVEERGRGMGGAGVSRSAQTGHVRQAGHVTRARGRVAARNGGDGRGEGHALRGSRGHGRRRAGDRARDVRERRRGAAGGAVVRGRRRLPRHRGGGRPGRGGRGRPGGGGRTGRRERRRRGRRRDRVPARRGRRGPRVLLRLPLLGARWGCCPGPGTAVSRGRVAEQVAALRVGADRGIRTDPEGPRVPPQSCRRRGRAGARPCSGRRGGVAASGRLAPRRRVRFRRGPGSWRMEAGSRQAAQAAPRAHRARGHRRSRDGPSMCHLDVGIQDRDGTTVMRLKGEFDLAGVDRFEQTAGTAEIVYGPVMVVDLSELSFIDSVGLGALARLHRRLARAGGALTVYVPPGKIERIFHYSGLKQAMDIRTPPA
ncbi:anti-anti-sigma factor [Streptomonospora nanhaiensis]|uniref:histidine kinase n=2 Tax=Streptomonospora nanhaiensis TaxID=1323731 RepID=A0A853BGR1_9ACTN|nr:histidine kinase dimerization/phospho-acceptor domain-containing protein [Streptomonospora nanhaiensis]NYI93914.1 anti-anti-sigma factor [Streptomonospora nanhaiensis]